MIADSEETLTVLRPKFPAMTDRGSAARAEVPAMTDRGLPPGLKLLQ